MIGQTETPQAIKAASQTPDPRRSPVGVRLIVAYKLGKAAVQTTLTIVLVVLMASGVTAELHDFVTRLRQHAASGWSIALAGLLVQVTTRHGVYFAMAALVADAGVSVFEGWALHKRYWWSPWLIVVATGSLLPIELFEIIRHPHLGRVCLFFINFAIVAYLIRRVRREKQEKEAALGPVVATAVTLPT